MTGTLTLSNASIVFIAVLFFSGCVKKDNTNSFLRSTDEFLNSLDGQQDNEKPLEVEVEKKTENKVPPTLSTDNDIVDFDVNDVVSNIINTCDINNIQLSEHYINSILYSKKNEINQSKFNAQGSFYQRLYESEYCYINNRSPVREDDKSCINKLMTENDKILEYSVNKRTEKLTKIHEALLVEANNRIKLVMQNEEQVKQQKEQARITKCNEKLIATSKTFNGGTISLVDLFNGSKLKYGTYTIADSFSVVSELFDDDTDCKDFNFFSGYEQVEVNVVSFYIKLNGGECAKIESSATEEFYNKYINRQCVGLISKDPVRTEHNFVIYNNDSYARFRCVEKANVYCSFSFSKINK